ncbi:unnamed protein product [Phytophthora fragariaefolia]|uniref:Unnamed protein product n=1 Tax=Phytophthora fragariaefolia TaxID=1490495 RepID=A0A9W7D9X7_9STRA|nr:unnamed protein product [Phytophthora fragariaefolia]
MGCRPAQTPLSQTPKKNEQGKESNDDGLIGLFARDTEASNAQRGDAKASSGRSRRRFVARDDSSDDDSGEDDYYRKEDAQYDDPSDELAHQVREVSEMERLNSTPTLEFATHRRQAQIKALSGLRNKSENSMQWLRTFVYEMKGARTPPNEWCMAFELSLRDGALHCRKNEARLEKPLRTSPEAETALTVVMSGVQSPRGTDIDGTDTDADMPGERTTPVTHTVSHSQKPICQRGWVRCRSVSRSTGGQNVRSFETCVGASRTAAVKMWKIGRQMTINREAITLTHTTLTIMIVASRPPTTLNAELRQSGRTAGLRTAAVAETSLTDGWTAIPATKALTGVDVSMDRVQHAGELTIPPTTVSSVVNCTSNPPTETRLVPIGLPQFPPVDADCVYAFVDESKWLKTQRREEVNAVNTTEIEQERSGSFDGGKSDKRRNDEWNGGSSEGLVSSVTKKTGLTTNPRT